MENRPNILVFIDWYYPGYKAGGPVRSCMNMVSHLKDDYNFFIVTRNTEYTEEKPYPNLKYNIWCNGPNSEKIIYLDQDHENVSFYTSLLEEREFSAVMIMGIFSNKYSILPLKAANRKKHSNILVSPRGMLAPEALKIKSAKKKLFLSYANLKKNYKLVRFHVTNTNEEKQVKSKIKSFKDIIVADNFPRKVNFENNIASNKQVGKLKLVAVARIAPEKNTKYALEILKECKGDVEFDIYGSVYDKKYWEECNSIIDEIPKNIKICYKGNLESEKLFEVLKDYDFLFLPTRGENFGHIILESFICGLPVIISNKTPWNDLQANKVGFEFDLLDRDGFKQCIEEVLSWNQEIHSNWKKNAFEVGREKMSNGKLIEQYKFMLK